MRAMKKATKRMIALCLAAIMTMAMAVSAFATMAEPMPTAGTTKGSLIVNVNDKNTLENQTIYLYRLFDIEVNKNSGTPSYKYTVVETYKKILSEVLSLDKDANSAQYFQAINKMTGDQVALQKFAKDFTKAALSAGTAADKDSGKILTAEQSYTFTDLPYGYYLVHQTGTKEFQSSLKAVVEANGTEVNLKGEAPSIEKTADKTSVEIGQIVKYTISGTIPDTTGYAEYQYKIHDTLTNGLDFVEDESGAQPNYPNYTVSVQIENGNAEEKQAQIEGDQNRKMTLDLSEWIRSKKDHIGEKFTVTYYAKVNENAVVAEENNASLEYGNKPGNTTTTTPVKKPTPTYPLNINKTDEDRVNRLAGATFRLYKEKTDADAGNENAIKVIGQNGKYVVNPDSLEMDMETVETDLDTKGYNLQLNGLAAGTYYLVETKAPAGYNKLTAPVKITITEGGETNVEGWTISKDDMNEVDKIIDIENSTGTILPETGGMGTVLFTAVAVIMILGVAISFIRSRRTEE